MSEDAIATCEEIDAEIVRVLKGKFVWEQHRATSALQTILARGIRVKILGTIRVPGGENSTSIPQPTSNPINRLPQLHAIASLIPNPFKSPEVLIFPFWINPNPGLSQRPQHLVQLIHAEVDHRLLSALAEVRSVQREMCQHRPPVRFRPGKEQRAAFGRQNAGVIRLPGRERLRIARAGRKTPPTPTGLAMATLPAG